MNEYRLPVADEQAMVDFGRRLAGLLGPGTSLYLRGDLGAGKTTLTRGVLRALGHVGAVKSPTYTLVEPYLDLPVPVYHFDLYRLGDPQEVEFMGIRDYFDAAALLVLEWPERGAAWLPEPDLDLHIAVLDAGRETAAEGMQRTRAGGSRRTAGSGPVSGSLPAAVCAAAEPRRAYRGVAHLLIVAGLLLSAVAQAVEVRDLRLWRAPDHTRLVLDLSGPAEHRLLTLGNPDRIVIDLSNARLLAGTESLELANTPISSIRSGVREGVNLRLVLDLREAVRPRSFALKASDRAADRVVIDLYDKGDGGAPAIVTKRADSGASRDIIIAIDAGHGGEDPGALGPGGLQEKKVVLEIARELHRLFEADRGFASTMIRTGDYYISLKGRRDLARKRQADMFVSIHADAFRDKRARGASVFALSTRGATSTTASYLAQRENAADLLGGVSLSDKEDTLAMTLADLSMTATLDSSLNVGASVLGQVSRFATLHKKQVEQAGFAVLKSPDVPSILVETGFISNPDEARKLASASYRKRIAAAIHQGIVQWFRQHPPTNTLLAMERDRAVREYTIVRGDTLSGIAQRFQVSIAVLQQLNDLNNSRILVGQTLRIPAS